MKVLERVLIKMVIIQFIFLILTQILLHQYGIFPELTQLTKYEGVSENSFTEIIQTLSGK
ncbi:YpfB family protein [Bacillus salipaludis]|uniref:YpfB family protein n=1 Tax=Bacillus salipaludis TaxID=2547811 RepID=UPI002E220EC3|nr:YpfB family protein [Bacillus salipaludis]